MHAQDTERHRSISQSYSVNDNTRIKIENKYGNIQVINWEKDSVKFDIEISVIGNKSEKVLKTFSYIDVDLSASNSYVSAKTVFKNEKNNFWTDVSDLTNSILKGGNSTEINYTVYMPKTNALDIKNKFGNVYLADMMAETFINISNGDLRANNFSGYLDLNFSQGTADINELNNAYINSNYAEFTIAKVNELKLESKSSTINCDKINSLKLNSKRDKLYLGEIVSVDGEFSLSLINIDILSEQLKLKSNFGDLIIAQVAKDFNFINISGRNTDISSTFEENTSFKLDLIYNKKTKLIFPTSYKNLKEEYVSRDKEESHLTASFGNNLSTTSKVTIMIAAGKVELIKK
jgi:ribosome-associated translation inhibitor RaiA